MAVNAIGALSAYTYQNTLTQTGSASQALSQALAASQAQADQVSALFGTSSSADSFLAQSGTGGLAALTYSAASGSASGSSSGIGTDALQALLGATSQTSSLFTNSDGQPSSAAMLAPSAAAALARYTYDQSQNHTATTAQTAAQAIASGQQSLLSSGLNLFA
jgi:hypothetical protein